MAKGASPFWGAGGAASPAPYLLYHQPQPWSGSQWLAVASRAASLPACLLTKQSPLAGPQGPLTPQQAPPASVRLYPASGRSKWMHDFVRGPPPPPPSAPLIF